MSVVPIDLTAAVMELTEAQQRHYANLDIDLDPDGLFLIDMDDLDDEEESSTEVPDIDDLDDEEESSYVVVYGNNNVAETPDLITRLRLLSLMFF